MQWDTLHACFCFDNLLSRLYTTALFPSLCLSLCLSLSLSLALMAYERVLCAPSFLLPFRAIVHLPLIAGATHELSCDAGFSLPGPV